MAVDALRRSRGIELERGVRTGFERAFGHDFSMVRVHADGRPPRLAHALHARAFAVGDDIAFAPGSYAPQRGSGRAVIAHELAHVVQQRTSPAAIDADGASSSADALAERAARAQVASIAAGRAPDPPRAVAFPALQRLSISDVLEPIGRFLGFEGTFSDQELQAYLTRYVDKGLVEGDYDSDNKAREIARRAHRGDARYTLTPLRRSVLIREMLKGYLSEGDQEAILDLIGGLAPQDRPRVASDADLRSHVGRFDEPARSSLTQLLAETERPAPEAAVARPRFATREPAVLPAQRAMYNQLLASLRDAQKRATAFLASGKGSEPWMRSDNPVMVELMGDLQALIAELAAERLVVRFDPRLAEPALAWYEFQAGLLRIRPIADVTSSGPITAHMLHEYTHVKQDRAAEGALVASRGRLEHTVDDEVSQERGGLRAATYFEVLADEAGLMPANRDIGESITPRLFMHDFEQARTGRSAAVRASAQRGIDREIRAKPEYRQQIRENAPESRFVIDLDEHDNATLRRGPGRTGKAVALGTVPRSAETREDLEHYLATQLSALPNYAEFFRSPSGRAQVGATFAVVRAGAVIAEIGLGAPPPAAPGTHAP